MAGLFKEEFNRMIFNKRFVLVVMVTLISFIYGFRVINQVQADQPLGAVSNWLLILKRGYFGSFAAVLAALPFADSIILDRKHHFIDQILMRVNYKEYLLARIICTILSGMLAVSGPAILLLLVCLGIFPSDGDLIFEIPWGIQELINPTVIEPSSTLILNAPLMMALTIILLMLFGASYAMLGLTASLLIQDPFVVMGVPFVVYNLGFYLIPTSRNLAWMGSSEAALLPTTNLLSALVQYLVFFLVCILLFRIYGRREQLLLDK